MRELQRRAAWRLSNQVRITRSEVGEEILLAISKSSSRALLKQKAEDPSGPGDLTQIRHKGTLFC
jgi:hypothetical protein